MNPLCPHCLRELEAAPELIGREDLEELFFCPVIRGADRTFGRAGQGCGIAFARAELEEDLGVDEQLAELEQTIDNDQPNALAAYERFCREAAL